MNDFGKLYVVATPIGNLADFSRRAVEVLSSVDLIAAEDTRVSGLLLSAFNIKKRMVSYHKFNEKTRFEELGAELLRGRSIALISDAGTPCISDPGHLLVAHAANLGIEVVGVSGPCAAITTLSISGFDIREYLYIGFLPREKGALIEKLKSLRCSSERVAVFYESPKRVVGTLQIVATTLPDAELCLCNDLSKRYERTYRGTADMVLTELRDNPSHEKGEYTCVIRCPACPSTAGTTISIETMLVDIMLRDSLTMKDAVTVLSAQRIGFSKKEIYAASLNLRSIL